MKNIFSYFGDIGKTAGRFGTSWFLLLCRMVSEPSPVLGAWLLIARSCEFSRVRTCRSQLCCSFTSSDRGFQQFTRFIYGWTEVLIQPDYAAADGLDDPQRAPQVALGLADELGLEGAEVEPQEGHPPRGRHGLRGQRLAAVMHD